MSLVLLPKIILFSTLCCEKLSILNLFFSFSSEESGFPCRVTVSC